MNCQEHSLPPTNDLQLLSERIGPLPLINHFLERLRLEALLDRFVPTDDKRVRLPFAKALGVLLRSLLIEREPIYRQQETVSAFAPSAFGLDKDLLPHVGDDAIGRALDRLFDADRGSLLTQIVLSAGQEFALTLDELHNDSTSIRFCGQYSAASGRSIRGKKAPFITRGFSKDHRPDLKQLIFILTTSRDGAVPVQFRCEAGNQSDSRTHEQTWDALCKVSGRTDFLYVADSKLCNEEAMDYIDRRKGRFVCVLPRSRREDREFRKWIQTEEPAWDLVVDRPHPRKYRGPRDRWWVYRSPIPSLEAWPVIWVQSSLLRLRQEQVRQERITRAKQELERFDRKLAGPRPRTRNRTDIQDRVDKILGLNKIKRYLNVKIVQHEEYRYRQTRPGRPGPDTKFVRKVKKRLRLEWEVDEGAVAYDRKSDGMYPLLTNDRSLAPPQVLKAHKRQPAIEKRFEQVKTVLELAPVLLKNEGRVEALFFVYFVALLVQAVIEREVRRSMERENIKELPIYPEERPNRHPTTEQIFRLFSHIQFHALHLHNQTIKTFQPELTDLQKQVLHLCGVSERSYRISSSNGSG
jgi:transposase